MINANNDDISNTNNIIGYKACKNRINIHKYILDQIYLDKINTLIMKIILNHIYHKINNQFLCITYL